MMFWVKKMVSMALMPVPMIIILLILSLLLLGRKVSLSRSLIVISVGLLILLSSQQGMKWLVLPLEQQYSVNSVNIERDCVVLVLGSGHQVNSAVPASQQLSTTGLARLLEGIRQLSMGRQCTLVTSGWSGEDALQSIEHSHAYIAAQAALEFGVPKETIVMQDKAKDTIEEAQWFKQRFGDRPFRLVTSATHMPRAMMIFRSQGLFPQPAPTDFIARDGYWWRLSARNLFRSERALHEYVGQLWFEIKRQFV